MPANPKQRRIVDNKYLAKIRKLQCIVKNSKCFGRVVAHHTKTIGSGGSDKDTVPICVGHHTELHFIGRDSFQDKYGINFKEYIKQLKGGVKCK